MYTRKILGSEWLLCFNAAISQRESHWYCSCLSSRLCKWFHGSVRPTCTAEFHSPFCITASAWSNSTRGSYNSYPLGSLHSLWFFSMDLRQTCWETTRPYLFFNPLYSPYIPNENTILIHAVPLQSHFFFKVLICASYPFSKLGLSKIFKYKQCKYLLRIYWINIASINLQLHLYYTLTSLLHLNRIENSCT